MSACSVRVISVLERQRRLSWSEALSQAGQSCGSEPSAVISHGAVRRHRTESVTLRSEITWAPSERCAVPTGTFHFSVLSLTNMTISGLRGSFLFRFPFLPLHLHWQERMEMNDLRIWIMCRTDHTIISLFFETVKRAFFTTLISKRFLGVFVCEREYWIEVDRWKHSSLLCGFVCMMHKCSHNTPANTHIRNRIGENKAIIQAQLHLKIRPFNMLE